MADQYDPYAYLQTFDGDAEGFLDRKKNGDQRLGQSFFNSLNDNDKWVLQNTDSGAHDPFYSDSREVVRNSVRHLLEFGS